MIINVDATHLGHIAFSYLLVVAAVIPLIESIESQVLLRWIKYPVVNARSVR